MEPEQLVVEREREHRRAASAETHLTGGGNMEPIVYAEIPEFNQETQAVFQLPPVERDDHIYVGVEVRDVELDEEIGEPDS
jgi:hypothetical protein